MNLKLPLIIRLKGGLGNQLFQYCFGKVIESRFGVRVYFDTRALKNADTKRSFELNHFDLFYKDRDKFFPDFSKLKNNIPLFLLASIYVRTGALLIESSEKNWKFWQSQKYKAGLYSGFWQDWEQVDFLFKDLSNKIQFVPDKVNNETFGNIINRSNNSIGVHIRGDDYKSHPSLVNLKSEYYKKAIDLLKEKLSNPVFFVFTDDVGYANDVFPEPNYTLINTGHGPTDLYLLSSCKNQIIANSTFSWWAATLNRNPKKTVIAPKTWEINKICHLNRPDWITI